MSRSPVNSTNASLFVAQARVHFHAAGQVQIAVNPAVVGHPECDGVIDPIAHAVLKQGVNCDSTKKGQLSVYQSDPMRDLHMIARALRATEGNKSKAVDMLGISSPVLPKDSRIQLG
jgi:Bacterial regulatory protein, Fis family